MISYNAARAIGLATVGHVTMHYMNYTFMQNFYGDTIVNQALATLAGLFLTLLMKEEGVDACLQV